MPAAEVPPIGERLREARRLRGVTVRGLARAIDVSASLISQIETGKSSPSVSTLYAITTALGISIEDVFGDPGAVSRRDRGMAPGVIAMDDSEQDGSGQDGSEQIAPGVFAVGPPELVGQFEPVAVGSGAAAGSGGSASGASGAVGTNGTAMDPSGGGEAGFGRADADHLGQSVTSQGLRMLARKRRVGPLVRAGDREVLQLDSGVTWELLGQLPEGHVDFLRITYNPGGSSSGAGVLMRHSGTEYGHVLSGQLTLTLGFETYVLGPGDSISFDSSMPHAYANHGTEPAVGVWFVLERSV
jgi:transcriptional regulator with XRE-family HTH domain/quercetin dioxygenase-like cupin family protein